MMGLLTAHHLMQMLCGTWGQPWALHRPDQAAGDGPCPPGPLVSLLTFLSLSFLFCLQISYLT